MSIHRFDFAAPLRPRALPAQGSSPEAEALKWGSSPLEAMEADHKARQARMMGKPRAAPVVKAMPTPVAPPTLTRWEELLPVSGQTMIRKIQLAVAEEFGIGVDALLSHTRSVEFITPRFIAIHLCREMTKKSLAIIGKAFAGRDHSTVVHAVRVARERLKNEPGFAARVAAVRERLA